MVNKKSILVIVVLFVLNSLLYSQDMQSSNSDEFSDMYLSYLLEGLTAPSLSFPVSFMSLQKELENDDADESLSKENIKDGLYLIENLSFTFQAFFNDRSKNYFTVFDFLEKKPFAEVGLGLFDGDKAGFYIELFARSEYNYLTHTNLFHPESDNPVSIDNFFVQNGYVFYNFEPLSVLFGRIPVHFGHPEFSSMLPSSRLPYMDSLYIKLPIGFVTMNLLISSLENREGIGDIAANNSVLGPADGSSLYAFEDTSIMTALHRFDMHWDNFNFSVAGFSIISRPGNTFNLGDFFPVIIWHNTDFGWHNLLMVFEASYAPFNGMDLYVQAGFDDINISDLLGIADSGNPTIDSYILGVLYHNKFSDFSIKSKLEFGYTHYLWGNFYDGTEPGGRGDHRFERAIYRYRMDGGIRILPLTSPFGPGSLWIELDLLLFDFYNFTINLNTVYLEKINNVDLINTPYIRNDNIRAANGVTRSVDINLTVSFSPLNWLNFSINPGLLIKENIADFHIDFTGSVDFNFEQKL